MTPLPLQALQTGTVLMGMVKPPFLGPGAGGRGAAGGGGTGAAGRETEPGFITQFAQTSLSDFSVTVLPQMRHVNS